MYKIISLITFILLFSTVHAAPISGIDVLQAFPDSIIGGNIYNITLEYNSESIFVVYHFLFNSTYPLDNNTPEIPYVELSVDDIVLNQTRIHQNNTLSVYSNSTLTQGRHNTTVYFALAHNIFPGNYTFLFEILAEGGAQEPIATYRSSGSSRSYRSHTKTCNFTVVRQWKPSENHTESPIVNDTLPEDVIPENITGNTTKRYVYQSTADALNNTQLGEGVEDQNRGRMIIILTLFAILVIFGWKWLLVENEKE